MFVNTFYYFIILPIFGFITYELIKSKDYIKLITIFFTLLFIMFVFYSKFLLGDIIFVNEWKTIILFIVLISFIIAISMLNNVKFDIYMLFILVFIGSFVMIISDHLLIIYLGIELQTFSLFILISNNRTSIKGTEAGLKYFILGAISSGVYLLGLSLFFVNGVSLNLKDINMLLGDWLTLIGCVLILISLSFKLTLAPFHFWIADIYEGSSWDVIILIAIISKISILVIFIQFVINTNFILFFSLLSVIIGTMGAINQSKLKRLVAYSAISHIGFITLGFSIGNSIGYEISFIYLVIYIISSLTLFIVIMNTKSLSKNFIIELSGLQYNNKILGLTWLLLLLSIAGIPPLSGFISKWFIIWNIICFDYLFSSIILIIFSIVGVGFYLRIIKIIYFQKKSSYLTWYNIFNVNKINEFKNSLFIGFSIFFTILIITNIKPLINLVNYLSYYLF